METLIAGAAAALIGVFAGRRLGQSHDMNIASARLGNVERLLSSNGITASSPDTLDERFTRLERRIDTAIDAAKTAQDIVETVLDAERASIKERFEELRKERTVFDEVLKTYVDGRLKTATQDLISRDEVQQAFARVAQIEAQRINAERQAQAEAAQQQAARAQQVFGVATMPTDMNTAINNQLAALSERLQQIGATMP